MDKVYIGIDVGSEGFISIQQNSEWEFISIADSDFYKISDRFTKLREENENNIVCVIEDVHALFGASAKSTFNFGYNKGCLIGILISNKIPYILISPKEWQKELWGNSDIVATYRTITTSTGKQMNKKDVNTKQTSINCCKRLFPTLDLRRTPRCSKIDDNKVDSILMCEYGRRKNL